MLMETRHMNVWSSQHPHVISHSCLKVVGFRGRRHGQLILWLNDVLIKKCEIVKHSAVREHLRHEGRADLRPQRK